LNADYRLCVTGTPKINKDADVWSLFQFLRVPGLMSLQEFRKQSAVAATDTGLSFVQRLYTTYVHRVTKQDIREQDMEAAASSGEPKPDWCTPREYEGETMIVPPSRTLPVGAYEREIVLTPTPALKRLYDCLLLQQRLKMQTMDESEHRTSVLAFLSYLRQLTLCPQTFFSDIEHRLKMLQLCGQNMIDAVLEEPAAKIQAVYNYVQQYMEPQQRALIFCEFRKGCEYIAKMLREKNETCIEINGDTPDDVRKSVELSFQSGASRSADSPRFMVSTMCMHEGLNLTEANHVIFVVPWWHSATERQAWGRAHRIGQKQNVHVVYIVLDQTIDMRVREISRTKTGIPSTKQLLQLLKS
jgi:SNF2 family DNA or RNA helicase